MRVLLGNDSAIEGYRDPTSDDPDLVRYRPIDGQRVTEIALPDDASLQEAFTAVTTAASYHFQDGAAPTWIEADSAGLQALLEEHYGVAASKTRPKTWGKDTGATLVTLNGPADPGGND